MGLIRRSHCLQKPRLLWFHSVFHSRFTQSTQWFLRFCVISSNLPARHTLRSVVVHWWACVLNASCSRSSPYDALHVAPTQKDTDEKEKLMMIGNFFLVFLTMRGHSRAQMQRHSYDFRCRQWPHRTWWSRRTSDAYWYPPRNDSKRKPSKIGNLIK